MTPCQGRCSSHLFLPATLSPQSRTLEGPSTLCLILLTELQRYKRMVGCEQFPGHCRKQLSQTLIEWLQKTIFSTMILDCEKPAEYDRVSDQTCCEASISSTSCACCCSERTSCCDSCMIGSIAAATDDAVGCCSCFWSCWDSCIMGSGISGCLTDLVTNSILFSWLFTIKDQCKKERFQQTHNQSLHQLFLTVSWDLHA